MTMGKQETRFCAGHCSMATSSSKGQPRVIVNSHQLSTLIASYNIHYAKYSNGRTQVTQVIPAAVWKMMYVDYLEVYPDSILAEKTLKDRVRETLGELDTGTSNTKRSNVAVLQSDEVLKKIRLTDGHASRNVLSHRSSIIAGKPSFVSPPSSPGFDLNFTRPTKTKNQTKAGLLAEQVESIGKICATLSGSSAKRDALLAVKIRTAEMKELKLLSDLGEISEEEMKRKVLLMMNK